MRISTKGRYGLAVMLQITKNGDIVVPISTLSRELGLSKIYLEQVLSLLKSGGLVYSTKGPQGGYGLINKSVSVKGILEVLEPSLFEKTERSCDDPIINDVLLERVFNPMLQQLTNYLDTLTLSHLSSEVAEKRFDEPMFYI
jgi:Rrf2 family protein